MKHLTLARAAAAAVAALSLLTVSAVAQRGRNMQEFVRRINGTWVLKSRINPDGTEHAQPIEGYTTFNLSVSSTRPVRGRRRAAERVRPGDSPAAREITATGTISSEESGVLDLRSSSGEFALTGTTASRTTTIQEFEPFSITANGSVDIRAMSEDETSSVMSLRYPRNTIKGSYGVFREGVSSPELESVYRFAQPRTRMVRGRTVTEGGDIALVNEPRMNLSDRQRGQAGGPGDPSHTVKRHVIRHDVMEIEYGNGTRDIWVRASAQPLGAAAARAAMKRR